MVCLDYASSTPDLHDVGEVDTPFILFVRYICDACALYVSRKTGSVDCETEVLEEGFLFGGDGEGEFCGEKGAVEGLDDMFALPVKVGDDADVVRC